MGHFAKVEGDVVTSVIVAEPEFFKTFVDNSAGQWIQTSYNTRCGIHYDPETGEPSKDQSKALRKNFAGIGFIYDREKDAFIPPKPFESWVLDDNTCQWVAPVQKPVDGNEYVWDEENLTWSIIVDQEGA